MPWEFHRQLLSPESGPCLWFHGRDHDRFSFSKMRIGCRQGVYWHDEKLVVFGFADGIRHQVDEEPCAIENRTGQSPTIESFLQNDVIERMMLRTDLDVLPVEMAALHLHKGGECDILILSGTAVDGDGFIHVAVDENVCFCTGKHRGARTEGHGH